MGVRKMVNCSRSLRFYQTDAVIVPLGRSKANQAHGGCHVLNLSYQNYFVKIDAPFDQATVNKKKVERTNRPSASKQICWTEKEGWLNYESIGNDFNIFVCWACSKNSNRLWNVCKCWQAKTLKHI